MELLCLCVLSGKNPRKHFSRPVFKQVIPFSIQAFPPLNGFAVCALEISMSGVFTLRAFLLLQWRMWSFIISWAWTTLTTTDAFSAVCLFSASNFHPSSCYVHVFFLHPKLFVTVDLNESSEQKPWHSLNNMLSWNFHCHRSKPTIFQSRPTPSSQDISRIKQSLATM